MSSARAIAEPTPRAGRGRQRSLTRRAVAQAALELADEHGLGALSMQKLASHHGVGTMTLYVNFRSKQELLDAVIDEAVLGTRLPPRRGTWRTQLRALLETAHGMLLRHPAVVELRMQRPVLRPDALHFGEAVMRILRDAGFDATEAAGGFRLLFTYLFGFSGLSPERGTASARQSARAAIGGLPESTFPTLHAAAAEFANAMAGEDQFLFGLDLLLDGLEVRLHSKKPHTRR